MIEVNLNNIEKFYGANKVLDNITFDVQQGETVGIIGKNGTGKTTIFKIISGLETFDKGDLFIRKGAKIGYLDQIPDRYFDMTVDDVLYIAFSDIIEIRNEMRTIEKKMGIESENIEYLMKKYSQLQTQYETLGGYDIDEKISKICTGLKLDSQFRMRDFNTLSGGEQTTVLLGKILLQSPDILLLDEPTNHLDLESIEWLEEFMKEFNKTVIIISHDRYFLDKVVNKIFEIERGKVNTYNGNYSYYLEEKERRYLEELQHYNNQQKKIEHMEDAIKRFRIWGAKRDSEDMYRKAKIMERKLEKIDRLVKPNKDNSKIKININTSRSGKEVIKINELGKKFDGKEVLKNLDLDVFYGEKVGIIGKNGSGKTTLLKLILKEYNFDSGEIKIGSNVKIGYLEQVVKFENEDMTILDIIVDYFNISQGDARRMLASYMFIKDDVYKKVKSLSGGEKSRLKLCILMNQEINLLILDEPTNHLDIDSREILEETLRVFDGTILFISHDRFFINRIAQRLVELNDKRLDNYLGNYDYYKIKKKEKEVFVENKQKEIKKIKSKPKVTVVDESKKIQKKLKIVEEEIGEYEKKLEEKTIEMTKYATDHNKLNEIYEEKCKIEKELEVLLDKWTDLQEKIH